MNDISHLTFVKKIPQSKAARAGLSPVERARRKLLAELDTQIELARDPDHKVRTERKKRGTNEVEFREKAPRNWVTIDGEDAYITVRLASKSLPLGGKKGSVVRCRAQDVVETLQTIRTWVQSEESTALISKVIATSRRASKQVGDTALPS